MDQVVLNPDVHIAGLVCVSHDGDVTMIPLDCYGKDVQLLDDKIVAGDIIVPHEWFESVQVCDDNIWEQAKRLLEQNCSLNLPLSQQFS